TSGAVISAPAQVPPPAIFQSTSSHTLPEATGAPDALISPNVLPTDIFPTSDTALEPIPIESSLSLTAIQRTVIIMSLMLAACFFSIAFSCYVVRVQRERLRNNN